MAMIEIKNVSKWYGSFQVLKNCSTSVEKGEVVVVCGPSGSGKSTLIKTVNALHKKPAEPEAPAEPTTKVCPYCQSEIAIKAVRCPHCTTKLEGFPEIND